MALDSSLSLEDTNKLKADGWYQFKPSSKDGNDEPPSLGWWWQKVYVSDASHYYGQKHLEEYTVHRLDSSRSVVIEHKVMRITLDRQFPLQERKIRITNNIVEIVFVETNCNDFPSPETFKILNKFQGQSDVVTYLKDRHTGKRKRSVKEVVNKSQDQVDDVTDSQNSPTDNGKRKREEENEVEKLRKQIHLYDQAKENEVEKLRKQIDLYDQANAKLKARYETKIEKIKQKQLARYGTKIERLNLKQAEVKKELGHLRRDAQKKKAKEALEVKQAMEILHAAENIMSSASKLMESAIKLVNSEREQGRQDQEDNNRRQQLLMQQLSQQHQLSRQQLQNKITNFVEERESSIGGKEIFKCILRDSIQNMLEDGLKNYNSHEQTGFGKGHRKKSMSWKFFCSNVFAAKEFQSLLPNGGNQVVSTTWLKSIGVKIPTRYYVRKNRSSNDCEKLSKLNLRKKNNEQDYTLEDYAHLVGLAKVKKSNVVQVGEKLRHKIHSNLLLVTSIDVNNSITIDIETYGSNVEVIIQYFISIISNQGRAWEEIFKRKDYRKKIKKLFSDEKSLKNERIEL